MLLHSPSHVMLDVDTAQRFATLALANVDRDYPNQPQHVWQSDHDCATPRELHPAFHGSYDWHSAVHMHWVLARVRRLVPGLQATARIHAVFDRHFTDAAIAGECAYLHRPDSRTFERTYGWAWLLKLAHELALSSDADAARWVAALAPLTRLIAGRFAEFLPRAGYAIRHGMHANSAFALLLALDYADHADAALATVLTARARSWFAADRDAPAAWEPSGADFLSPALNEAALMTRVLALAEFAAWFAGFLPGFGEGVPATLMTPATVADRTDPQIVHLDGLNLSRAWCFKLIARAFADDGERAVATAAAARHLRAGIEGLASADYGGEHWLASFALLALTE